MITRVRDQILELTCRRHNLRTDDARGVDSLPVALLDSYASMLPTSLGEPDLREALSATTACLVDEVRRAEPELAQRIAETLQNVGSLA